MVDTQVAQQDVCLVEMTVERTETNKVERMAELLVVSTVEQMDDEMVEMMDDKQVARKAQNWVAQKAAMMGFLLVDETADRQVCVLVGHQDFYLVLTMAVEMAFQLDLQMVELKVEWQAVLKVAMLDFLMVAMLGL